MVKNSPNTTASILSMIGLIEISQRILTASAQKTYFSKAISELIENTASQLTATKEWLPDFKNQIAAMTQSSLRWPSACHLLCATLNILAKICFIQSTHCFCDLLNWDFLKLPWKLCCANIDKILVFHHLVIYYFSMKNKTIVSYLMQTK